MIRFMKRARWCILLLVIAGTVPQLGGCIVRDHDDHHDHDFDHDHDHDHDHDWH